MGGREKSAMPLEIKMALNTKTGYYEAREDGILYQLTFEQMNDMKHHVNYHHKGMLGWFNNLSLLEKKKVKRSGHKEEHSGFWPDE